MIPRILPMLVAMLVAMLSLPALGQVQAQAQARDPVPAEAWQIGPLIDGRNYSRGMPRHPTPSPEGWYFDFPHPDDAAGHVHYLTFAPGSLQGARAIRLRYRIDAGETVRFVPQEFPDLPATLSLFFQRAGDDWRAKGAREFYRWYAPHDAQVPITRGTHEVTIPLTAEWISVYGKPRSEQGEAFAAALANASRAGFVLGSASGRGHGVFASGPARMTVLRYDIIR